MNICQVGFDLALERGGRPRAVFDIQDHLGGSIISITDTAALRDLDHERIHHVPMSGGLLGRAYRYADAGQLAPALEILRKADVVLVHGLYRYHFDWAVRSSRRHGRPYVILPHGSLDPHVFSYRGWQKRPWMALQRRNIEHAHCVLFASARERDKAFLEIVPARHDVVLFPVSLPDVSDHPARREAARTSRGYAGADCVMLFFGRFSDEKRPLEIVEAFARAARQAPHLRLLMVGPEEGITREACAQYARELGVGDAVRMEPPAYGADRESVFAAADCYVNYAHRENFGYALCEALAYGLPAIASAGNDLGGMPGIDQAVRLLPADGQDLLGQAILESAASREALAARGQNGRQWVLRNLAPDRFRSSLSDVLNRARSVEKS